DLWHSARPWRSRVKIAPSRDAGRNLSDVPMVCSGSREEPGSIMKNLHRVVWSKGMFLTPQHFQTQDAYFEDLFQFRFAASQFANWGITDLSVDEQSLGNGLFTLRHCQGVLPDGLVFNIPESDEIPAERPVAEFFAPSQTTLDVYLGVPKRRQESRNFTLRSNKKAAEEGSRVSTRYVADTRSVVDENLGDEKRDVQVARRNLHLLMEGENLDGLTTLRIAQISRD